MVPNVASDVGYCGLGPFLTRLNSGEFISAFGSRRETVISAQNTKIHVNSRDFVLDSNMFPESEVIKHTLFAM